MCSGGRHSFARCIATRRRVGPGAAMVSKRKSRVAKEEKKEEPPPAPTIAAQPQGIGQYLWCACHGDVQSDMEDVELESLWEEVLTKTGASAVMDPFYRDDWHETFEAFDVSKGLDDAYASASGAMSPRDAPPPPDDNRRSPGGTPRMSVRFKNFFLAAPNAAAKKAERDEKRKEDAITIDMFDCSAEIGRGAFSTVHLARKIAEPHRGRLFAIKRMDKSGANVEARAKKERQVLSLCRGSPFTLHCRFAFQDESSRYIVTDYYAGGSLEDQLSCAKNRCFAEKRARYHGVEILLAIKHMHEQGVCHRDVKLENMLMQSDGHVVVADMGFAKTKVEFCEEKLRTFCGTVECVAPELLRGQPYGFMVDWWAFGILLFQMVVGKTPFHHENPRQMFSWILKSPPPTNEKRTSKALLATVTQLLRKEAKTRLGYGKAGAADVMASPLFHGLSFSKMAIKGIEPPFKPKVVDLS